MMKKILLISNRVMHYRIPVYNYFARRFHESGREFLVRSNELQTVNTHPLQFDYRTIPFSFSRYRGAIQTIRPDMVILFLHLKNRIIWPLFFWLKWKRIPVVFWTKGRNLDKLDSWLSNRLYDLTHALADGLILYSPREKHLIHKKHWGKISVANNTVNFEDFPEITQTKEEIKKEFDIPFKKVVLFTGRMGVGGGRKKVEHLLKIFAEISNPDYGLVIVGSGLGEEQRRLMNPVNTLYLGEIHDPEHVQISKLFKMADLFCIPGHVGLGLNQAFYWGLPVVTEEGGQPPEIHYLVNNRNGFQVAENDVKGLKARLLLLLENDELRREFSENARRDILEQASIENMYQGFRDAVIKQEQRIGRLMRGKRNAG